MFTRQQPPAGTRESESEPDPSGDGSSPAGLDSLVKDLRSDLRGIYDSLKRTVFVEWQRIQWRANDALFRAVFIFCLSGIALAASISAALLIVRGIREALVAWSHVGWIGDLGAGFLILVIMIGGGLAVRARLRNGYVRNAKRVLMEKGPLGSDIP